MVYVQPMGIFLADQDVTIHQYAEPVGVLLANQDVTIHQYADDTQLYRTIACRLSTDVSEAQSL